jgi:hypothetical protein
MEEEKEEVVGAAGEDKEEAKDEVGGAGSGPQATISHRVTEGGCAIGQASV